MKRWIALFCAWLLVMITASGAWAGETIDYMLGDPNGDGAIMADDALMVLRATVGKESLTLRQQSAADVDCSDDIGAGDALQILRNIIGKPVVHTGLKGNSFTIGSVYASKYTADTPFGRAWQQAVAKTEQAYGVTVTVVPLDLQEESDSLFFYDMIEVPVHSARSLAKRGKLMDLKDCVVFPESVLQSGSTQSCQMGEHLYGVASDAMSANPMGLTINCDLLKQYAPKAYANLQSQFEKKEWTWEALNSLVAEYRTNSGNRSVMISNTNIIGQAIVSNAGYEVDFLPDGSGAVSSIASDEGIAALHYVKQLYDSGAYVYQADMNRAFEQFQQGTIPMVVYYLNETATATTARTFATTAMPFPIGPAQQDYVMCTFNSSVFAVPAGMSQYGNAYGMVLSMMAAADETIQEGWVAEATAKGYDKLGQSVYRWAAQHTTRDFSTGPFTGAVGGPVDGSVLNPDMDPYVEIPKIKKVIQQEVDAYYGQFYKS